MRQKLCKRLEGLEKISAAAAQRIDSRVSADAAIEKIRTVLHPNNLERGPKESLAEIFARYLGISSWELRAQLQELASGNRGGLRA